MKKLVLTSKKLIGILIFISVFVCSQAFATVNTVTITAPTVTTVAPGATFTITATVTYSGCGFGFYGVTFYSYSGATINTAFSSPYTSSTITAPTTPGTYTYTVTGYDNCFNSKSATIAITVALATPSISGGGASGCGSGSVTLTASGGSPAGGTYNWYSSTTGGVVGTGTTFAPITSGTYYTTYTYSGSTSARSTGATVTINPTVSSPYSGAYFSYPFNGNAKDVSGNGNDALLTGAPTLTTDRYGATNSAYSFNGSSQYMSSPTVATAITAPASFTISIWFNTTTTTGGKLIGFGGSQTGGSGSYDRHLYMTNSGQLYFGLYTGAYQTINTTGSYNDGAWHHVIVTVGSDGSTLYVDGSTAISSTAMTTGQAFTGWWRIGYDNVGGWPNAPTSNFFSGKLDDIAVYSRELTSAEIASSNNLNQIGAYAAVCAGSPITLYAPLITGATYTWKDASGTTVVGQNPTFSSAVVGNYTLTVTGGPGGCSSTATVTPTINSASATFSATSSVLVGNNATITYTGTDPATSTYTWGFNGGTVLSGSGQGPYQVQWSSTGTKTITLSVLNANGCSGSSSQTVTVSAASAWYSNYVYREKITVNKSDVAGSTDLSNFPVLLKVVDANLIYTTGVCTNKIQTPTLTDLAFTDGTSGQTAELPYQIDTYDNTTGTLLVWVKVPTLAASGSTTPATSINMYYGSTAPPVTHNTAFYQTTWKSVTSSSVNYNSVYHFNETPVAGSATLLDATSSGVNLTASSSLVTSFNASQIGTGLRFTATTGTGGNVSATPTTYPVNGTPLTMSYWCYYPNYPGSSGVNPTQNGMVLSTTSGVLIQLGFTLNQTELWPSGGRSNPYANSTSLPSSGYWHYYSYTWDGTNNALYIDGVAQVASTTYKPTGQAAVAYNGIMFADYPNDVYSEEFDGSVDEGRVIGTAMSANWVATEYTNQLNPTITGTAPFIASVANIEYNLTNFNNGYSPGSMVYTWTGTGGTSVATASNWNITSVTPNVSGSAPTGTYASVNIPNVTTYPQLGPTPFTIYSLTMGSAAKLYLNGYSLTIGCDIINSTGGQILYGSSNASNITWNGSLATQNYYGSTTGGTGQTGTMIVNNTSGGTVNIKSGGLDIYSLLTMTKGNLAIGTSPAVLTLKSSATQSAALDIMPSTSSITGNVNVERYLTGNNSLNYRSYRLLSSPVNISSSVTGSGNISLANLSVTTGGNYGAAIGGPGGVANGFTITNTNPTVYLYYEPNTKSITAFLSGKNVGIASIGATYVSTNSTQNGPVAGVTVPVGNGYILYFIGSTLNGTRTSGSSATVPDNTTVTNIGTLNQQGVTVNLWYTPAGGTTGQLSYSTGLSTANYQGYNMVGNPYASTINLQTVLTDNSSSIDAIYLLTDNVSTGQKYVAFTANGTSAPSSGYAVTGEGFMVHAIGTAKALKFKESEKVPAQQLTGTALLMGKPKDTQQALTGLYLKMEKDSSTYEYCGIYYRSDWVSKFKTGDALYLTGISPKVYMSSLSSDSVHTSVNHQPDYTKGSRVKLHVDAAADGLYNLKLEGVRNIDTTFYNIFLVDHYKKDSLDIRRYGTYAFNIVKSDSATYGDKRFELVIELASLPQYRLLSFAGLKVIKGIQLNWKTDNENVYTNFVLQKMDNATGKFNQLYSKQSDGSNNYDFVDASPNTGSNVYRLQQVGINGNITYSATVTIVYDAAAANGSFSVYPNPTGAQITVTINSTTQNAPDYEVTIYNSAGRLMSKKTLKGNTLTQDVTQYKPGGYVIQLIDNKGNIAGTSKFIKTN